MISARLNFIYVQVYDHIVESTFYISPEGLEINSSRFK